MQYQGSHHDQQHDVGLNVDSKGCAKIDHRHQQQVSQQNGAFPPVVFVPATYCDFKCGLGGGGRPFLPLALDSHTGANTAYDHSGICDLTGA